MRRAVAPIIATLLMVAISIVGGILVFVFAQDFFTNSSVSAPTIDTLELFGYDATDSSTLATHAFVDVTVSGAADQRLVDGDAIAVYIRNRGTSPVVIEQVMVYGFTLTFDTGATTVGALAPDNNEWLLTRGTDTPTSTGNQVINAGEELTLLIGYDESINGEVKMGRPIPVVIKTGSGAVFAKQLTNGLAT